MNRLIRILHSLLFLIGVSGYFGAISAQTEPNFLTTITSEYVIENNGFVFVNQKIQLVNQSSSVYATKYALEIGSANIQGIQVLSSSNEDLDFEVTDTANSKIVSILLPPDSVGKGKMLEFNVNYQQLDIAQLYGEILEITIPRLNQIESTATHITRIKVPSSFGKPKSLRPDSDRNFRESDYQVFEYEDFDKQAKGIMALFGDKRAMQFTLNYHLDNPSVNKGVTQIALPPDTPYQKLSYSKIDPMPREITSDVDGNWLATYVLEPKQRLDIVVQGTVELYLEATVPVKNHADNLQIYTEAKTHWPSTDPEVKKLASELKTAESIYSYLVETFTYNYDKLDNRSGRSSGKVALDNPTDVLCQEFTDAFITLARAAGIPAREHNGYAFTANSNLRPLSLVQDILHAWPEYYDYEQKRWIPVDPTWGNTTGGVDYFSILDLNHFTFVIHGQNSETPYAAGYYRYDGSTEKDILVSFTNEPVKSNSKFSFKLEPHVGLLSGLSFPSTFTVTNEGSSAVYNASFDLRSDWKLKQPQITIPIVLPYSTASTSIEVIPPRAFYTKSDNVAITYDNDEIIIPLHINREKQIIFISFIFGMVVSGAVITFFARGILVSRQK